MASGQPVLRGWIALPPTTLFAYQMSVLGGSTPAEQFWPFAFDDNVQRYVDFLCLLQNYGGGGLTFQLDHDTSTGTAGNNARIGIAVRRIDSNSEDLDTAHTYDYNFSDLATPATRGRWMRSTMAFTNGADMDSVADGERCIIRVQREGNHANDTIGGIWLLHGISAIET